mgnify:CR=1 FL=1
MSLRSDKLTVLKKVAQFIEPMREDQYAELAKLARYGLERWAMSLDPSDETFPTAEVNIRDLSKVATWFNGFMKTYYEQKPALAGTHDQDFTIIEPYFNSIGEMVVATAQENMLDIIDASKLDQKSRKPATRKVGPEFVTLKPGESVSDSEYTYVGIGPKSFSWTRKSDGKKGTFSQSTASLEDWTSATKAVNKLVIIQKSHVTPEATPVAGATQDKIANLRKLSQDRDITKDIGAVLPVVAPAVGAASAIGRGYNYLTGGEKEKQDEKTTTSVTPAAATTTAPPAKQLGKSVEKLEYNKDVVLNLTAGQTVSDEHYVYTGVGSTSFSWKSKTDGKSGIFKKESVKPAAWTSAVTALNKLVASQATSATSPAAGAGQTPQAATAPSAPTESQAATPAIDNLVINVARLLSNVNAGHTYAGKTVFKNEQAMVRGMLAAITNDPKLVQGGNQMVIDAPITLSKIIVGSTRGSLNNSALAAADPTEVQGMTERDIESRFRGELDIIMRGIAMLDKMLGGPKGYARISTFFSAKQTPAAQATTTVAPPAKAASNTNEKIVRLASLRRVKVRSQMDAAIDSSARIGTAKV